MQFKKLLFASAMMLAWLGANAIELPELPTREGNNLKGYVHDGTKGIGGVLVTDGYSFTKTGEDGSYYMASNPGAWCVYVVLPSGYEYGTVDQGIVKHFVTLQDGHPEQQADFQLNPIGDDSSFSFIVHADTQPSEYIAGDCWTGMMDLYKDLQTTGEALTRQDGFAPFNLHLGDIIYNTNTINADYYKYKQNLAVCGYTIPMLTTPGNHDRRYKTDYLAATTLYRAEFGPTWFSFNRGNIHFISMDNVKVETDGEYTRGFPEDAIQWLMKDLSYVPADAPIVFFTHQPITRSKAYTKVYKTVLDLLKTHKTLILTGHLHKTRNDFPEYAPDMLERNTTSAAGYEWRGPCSTDGTPLGYCIYTVNGNDISWKFKWTKRDADRYMFRLYNPGDLGAPSFGKEQPKTIYANVWDRDQEWKVTWRMQLDGEDFKEMGDLTKCDGEKDPWAVYCYEGTDKGYDAGVSSHLFRADVPANCAKVEVTVTDRFGRTSTSSLSLAHAGIESISAETSGVSFTEVFNLQGVKLYEGEGYPFADTLPLAAGVYIYRLHHTDGTISTEKNAIK